MLKDIIKTNENIKPNSREIEKLKIDFPQFFDGDGEFLIDRFEEILKQSDIALSKEGYELKFLGKSYARYLSSTKTETFIAPHVEENAKEENKDSENLYIIGDNLDALKHLLGSYAGKIKCIYIDPPYNTGSDGFIYPDNFSFDAKKLADTIGIEEEEAERIINLKGKSSHSAWLTFMYPRLILARELLSDDGAIFISIDDNEQANLKLMCDEVFGEENFVVTFSRVTKKGGKSSEATAKNHDYVLTYLKNYDNSDLRGVFHNDEGYCNKDDYFDERGFYKLNQTLDYDSLGYVVSLDYPIEIDGETFYAGGSKENYTLRHNGEHGRADWGWRWRWSKDLYDFGLKNGFIKIKRGGQRPRIYTKTYQNAKIEKVNNEYKVIIYKRTKPLSTLEFTENIYSNDNATKGIDTILGKGIFEYTKPIQLIQKLMDIANSSGETIMDFFSGSATTAHAVMQLNAEDGGNRKYILVQIPEQIKEDKPAYKAGYRTIDEIGRERIRRAAKKIKEETGVDIDYGFKTYSLEKLEDEILTNLDYFDDNPKLVSDDMVGVFDTDKAKGKDAILSTYLVLDGYGLSVNSEEYKLNTYVANKVRNSIYIIEDGLGSEDVMELIKRIETLELDITRVVVYTPSLDFHVLHELKKNLSNLRNNKSVELIERY